MTIKLIEGIQLAGVHQPPGAILTLTPDLEARHVSTNRAIYTKRPAVQGAEVPAMVVTDTLTGRSDFSDRHFKFDLTETARSILTIGGDHPYAQWWGSNGNDGLGAMFASLGIKPYIAICADESTESTSGQGATLGKAGMLSIAQAQALQKSGAEFISHGGRHTHFWELFNTGIRVYYTGAEATPTVNISTTQLTTNTATTGATNFLFATYPTIAQLQTAINALAGWNCILATELNGAEPSAALMPLNAARSVIDPGGADTTKSNQRFALSGGIMIRYTGSTYRCVSISVNDGSNFFSVFADGARLLAQSTAATLSTIVTAINALNVTGLTALIMDNGYNATTIAGSSVLNPGQKQRETYCYGDELGTSLQRIAQLRQVGFTGVAVSAGVGFAYTLRRSVRAVKERATSLYGLNITAFAQPGGRFFPWHADAILDEHLAWRGNRSFTENYSGISPHAMPMNLPGKFSGHFTSIIGSSASMPYSEADVKAVVDALGDSDGWYVNWLNHLCTPTPGDPSPFTGLNQHSVATYTSGADQDEGPYYRELVYAAAARDAGKIDILPPTTAERIRMSRRGPSNLIFNPKFRNGRANNLLNISTSATGSGGVACPGWNIVTASTDFSVATVDADGNLTLTTNGALGANKTPIGSNLLLERGKTYSVGATLDLSGLPVANSVRWMLYPLQSAVGEGFDGQSSILMQPIYGGTREASDFKFTVPLKPTADPAYVRGIAGPFAFTAGDAITINIDNKGTSAAIVLTGLTTAKAVASAINTALASDAIYGPLAQYHNAAQAINNRLVIQSPLIAGSTNDTGSLMQLSNQTGTPLPVLFGAGVTAVRATSQPSANLDSGFVGYRLALVPSSTSGTATIVVSAPFCREVRY